MDGYNVLWGLAGVHNSNLCPCMGAEFSWSQSDSRGFSPGTLIFLLIWNDSCESLHPIKNVNQNRIMMTLCKCVTGMNQRCISSFEQILWFWCHETLNWCYQLCKYVVFGWRSTWTQKRDHCCRMAEYGGVGWGEDASTIGIIEVGLTWQRSWERLSNVKWSWPWTVFFFRINFVTSVHCV